MAQCDQMQEGADMEPGGLPTTREAYDFSTHRPRSMALNGVIPVVVQLSDDQLDAIAQRITARLAWWVKEQGLLE